MAYFKCNQASGGGGGGTMTETALWTNANPSATTFAAQSASLSEDIDNYDWICVEYARAYNQLTTTNKVYYKVSDYKTFRYSSNTMCGGLSFYGSAMQVRAFYYDSDTQAHFGPNLQAGSAVNGNNIPLNIYGCKIS